MKRDRRARRSRRVLVAVPVQGPALDVLHDEVRLALFRFACVEQPRDVGVIETGENLTFRAKAQTEVERGRAIDHFDRGLPGELTVGPLGQIHRARAAPTQDRFDSVVGDDAPDPAVRSSGPRASDDEPKVRVSGFALVSFRTVTTNSSPALRSDVGVPQG